LISLNTLKDTPIAKLEHKYLIAKLEHKYLLHFMSQAALNSLAVLIFCVTCSIVLGPFFHLSPLVPALVTLGALGFLTVDAAGFQGQGLTLLLDLVAQRSPHYQARILHHEAGHFLTAHLLNIPITAYTLSAWEAFKHRQAGQGGVTFDCSELEGNQSVQLVERYCTVWMAGVVAETLVYGTFEGGAGDRRKLKQLWTQLQQNYQQKEHAAALRARSLLQENWSAYEALVTAMQQRVSVLECQQVIDCHCNATTKPVKFS